MKIKLSEYVNELAYRSIEYQKKDNVLHCMFDICLGFHTLSLINRTTNNISCKILPNRLKYGVILSSLLMLALILASRNGRFSSFFFNVLSSGSRSRSFNLSISDLIPKGSINNLIRKTVMRIDNQ